VGYGHTTVELFASDQLFQLNSRTRRDDKTPSCNLPEISPSLLLRMICRVLFLGASLLTSTWAQSSGATATSTYVEPTVPTGTPIPGDYTGALRPQIHYSPPINFMNDPNGMFYLDGLWHLYYQCKLHVLSNLIQTLTLSDDATGTVAGNQHWGAASSPDLYHWTNEPIALFPPNNFTFVFSGSAVVDVNNTSGFFPNQTNGVYAFPSMQNHYL
jgi:beta-fructofuranosidase